jgi:hypothetical protein
VEGERRAAGSRVMRWAVGFFVVLAAACLGHPQPDESEISGRWEPTPETLELVKPFRQFSLSTSWITLEVIASQPTTFQIRCGRRSTILSAS